LLDFLVKLVLLDLLVYQILLLASQRVDIAKNIVDFAGREFHLLSRFEVLAGDRDYLYRHLDFCSMVCKYFKTKMYELFRVFDKLIVLKHFDCGLELVDFEVFPILRERDKSRTQVHTRRVNLFISQMLLHFLYYVDTA
jgi:hypothetical protein